jgi:hypothetical protein
MLVVIAIAAFIIVCLLVLWTISSIRYRARIRHMKKLIRPTYHYQTCHQDVYALTDWITASKQSLEWSRNRRGKEID